MIRIKHIVLYMAVCMMCTMAQAQTAYNQFKKFMVADGLSDNSVLCGLQDRYGFMWFGTKNGLNCFDGTSNRIFRNSTGGTASIESNIQNSLFENGDDIWVGSTFGLSIYHRSTNTFSRFDVRTRYGVLVSSTVKKMLRSTNNRVWIATLGQGLFVYNQARGTLTQDSRHGAFVSDLVQGADKRVYAATMTGTLMVFNANGAYLRSYPIPNYVNNKNGLCVAAIGQDIWVGSDAGLYRLDRLTQSLQKFTPAIPFGTIHSILPAQDGTLLLGTDRGLYTFTPQTGTFSRADGGSGGSGLSDYMINALLRSRDGTLWVMTDFGGVNYVPRQANTFGFVSLPTEEGMLSRPMVTSFCQTTHGSVWIGTNSGLYVYNTATSQITPYANPDLRLNIQTLAADGPYLWIGTHSDGIRVLNTQTGQVKTYKYSATKPYTVTGNVINCIYRTTQGNIYVGTNWGICRFDRAHERFMGFPAIGAMTSFTDIEEDNRGNLWATSDNMGVYRMDIKTGAWYSYTYNHNDPHSIPGNSVTLVMGNGRGQMWFATNSGDLFSYNYATDHFMLLDKNHVVVRDRTVYAMAEDRRRRLWIAGDMGLTCVNPDNLSHSITYTRGTDLWRGSFIQRSSYTSPAGFIYMGSTGGFYRFSPDLIKQGARPAPVYIMSLSFPFAEDTGHELQRIGLDRPLYMTKEINLPFRDNSFTVHFASPNYSGAGRVSYEYKLEGVDQNWARGTENTEATYANVAPGTYVFKLRRAGEGHEGDVASLTIVVSPPWYRTAWAYLAYLLMIAAVTIGATKRARTTLRRKYERKIETYRTEQQKIAYQSKIRFFVNLVHEIRTPLSLMRLPIEGMEEQPQSETNHKYLSIIRKNIDYLLGTVNQLLDFQKAESGKIALNLKRCDMASVARDVYEQFAQSVKMEGKNIELHLSDERMAVVADADKMAKIMVNIVGNAVKYARNNIVVSVEKKEADNRLVIAVADDGPGIPDSEKQRVFEKFYQVQGDDTAASQGTGIGLAFAQMLAEAHHGSIHVENNPTGGSRFVVEIPLDLKTDSQPEKQAVTEDVETSEDNASSSTKHFTILVTEDNTDLLAMVAEGLRKWYRVLKARNGNEAIDVLKHNDVDILVSDVMMPEMDGIELCHHVKTDINLSHIPVILLTAKTTLQAKEEGMANGADIYMEKPFTIKQLRLQIENLLRLRQTFYKRMAAVDGENEEDKPANEYGLTQQDYEFTIKLQKLVNENLADDEFSLDLLASQMNMSRSSFYRKIKQLTGASPADYVKNARLNRAATLIRQGLRIVEVFTQTGFTSSSYFAKCFKAKFGMLPKEYQDKMLKKEKE